MMSVRCGNPAPAYWFTHGPQCISECPARHDVVTGYQDQVDENGNPVLDENGQPVQTPVVAQVHDGTKERIVVALSAGETYRVTTHDLAVFSDEDAARLFDDVFMSITHRDGAWSAFSDASAPLWVESNWADLERRLAAWWNCPIGEPAGEGS